MSIVLDRLSISYEPADFAVVSQFIHQSVGRNCFSSTIISPDNHSQSQAVFVRVEEASSSKSAGAVTNKNVGSTLSGLKPKAILNRVGWKFNNIFHSHRHLLRL